MKWNMKHKPLIGKQLQLPNIETDGPTENMLNNQIKRPLSDTNKSQYHSSPTTISEKFPSTQLEMKKSKNSLQV
jgi:hypothetical protein